MITYLQGYSSECRQRFTAPAAGIPNSLAHKRIVAACIPGKDVPMHHQRFDGAMIASGFWDMRLRSGHIKNCS
jgi:hypothetical protein